MAEAIRQSHHGITPASNQGMMSIAMRMKMNRDAILGNTQTSNMSSMTSPLKLGSVGADAGI